MFNPVFQGVFVSDDALRKTYLEPENQEDKDEMVRHPDLDGKRYKRLHALPLPSGVNSMTFMFVFVL